MTTKKTSGFSKTLLRFVLLIPSLFRLFKNITSIISYEARLAGKSAVEIIILAVLFGILLSSTWLGLLAFLYTYLVTSYISWKLAFAVVIGLNIILMIVICFCIKRLRRNLLFLATRYQLHLLDDNREDY